MGWPRETGYTTDLQVHTWLAWLRMDVGRPGKAEWYQMGTSCEVRRVLSRQPSQHQVHHHLLQPVEDAESPGGEGPGDDNLDAEKEAVFKALGGGRYTPPPEPDEPTDEDEVDEDEVGGEDDDEWEGPPISDDVWGKG